MSRTLPEWMWGRASTPPTLRLCEQALRRSEDGGGAVARGAGMALDHRRRLLHEALDLGLRGADEAERRAGQAGDGLTVRSEEHTCELQSPMGISSAAYCLNKHRPSHVENNT